MRDVGIVIYTEQPI